MVLIICIITGNNENQYEFPYYLVSIIIYARLLTILRIIWQKEDENEINPLSIIRSLYLTILIFVMELLVAIFWLCNIILAKTVITNRYIISNLLQIISSKITDLF